MHSQLQNQKATRVKNNQIKNYMDKHLSCIYTQLVMKLKGRCKRDDWVELHQNPSYESINQGPAKWALATLELIHAMRVVIVEDELG